VHRCRSAPERDSSSALGDVGHALYDHTSDYDIPLKACGKRKRGGSKLEAKKESEERKGEVWIRVVTSSTHPDYILLLDGGVI
jgi:hypothetical protein